MAASGQSLNAVTATGAGTAIAPTNPSGHATMIVTTTGSPVVTVDLEGSVDGTNWVYVNGLIGSAAPLSYVDSGNSFVFTQFRANLKSLVGGTSPTVTAYIAVAQ